MNKILTTLSAVALVAATSTAALAQDVPLNTQVAGGEGSETLKGQAAGATGVLTAMGVVAGLTVISLIAASDDSETTVSTAPVSP